LRLIERVKRSVVRSRKEGLWETTIYISLKVRFFSDIERLINMSEKPFIIMSVKGVKYSVSSFRNMFLLNRRKRWKVWKYLVKVY
jgi:hypothetical protein